MVRRTVDFSVVDADNHLYETEEAFTRYLPAEHKNAVRYVEVDGRTKIAVRGTISEYIPNPTFEVVAAPGAHEELYRRGNPEGKTLREMTGDPIRCPDWAREPASRLAKLDELGIDAALMFPTLASLLEERMRDDPDLTHAAIHAFNRWLHDQWSFNYRDRIFATPVITLPIVDKAIEELEWCLERGARAVLIRPAPAWGLRGPRSPGLPEFDPLWARIEEAGVLVAMHASDSGYADISGLWEGRGGEMLPFKPNPLRAMVMGSRPIKDTMAALDLPWRLDALPRFAHRHGRERRHVGPAAARGAGEHLQEDAAGVSGAPGRGVHPQRLRQPLLGRRARRAHRGHRQRPRAVRLRLPASRGPG